MILHFLKVSLNISIQLAENCFLWISETLCLTKDCIANPQWYASATINTLYLPTRRKYYHTPRYAERKEVLFQMWWLSTCISRGVTQQFIAPTVLDNKIIYVLQGIFAARKIVLPTTQRVYLNLLVTFVGNFLFKWKPRVLKVSTVFPSHFHYVRWCCNPCSPLSQLYTWEPSRNTEHPDHRQKSSPIS